MEKGCGKERDLGKKRAWRVLITAVVA